MIFCIHHQHNVQVSNKLLNKKVLWWKKKLLQKNIFMEHHHCWQESSSFYFNTTWKICNIVQRTLLWYIASIEKSMPIEILQQMSQKIHVRPKMSRFTTKWNLKGFFYKSAKKWFLLLKNMEKYALYLFFLRIIIETVVEKKFFH